MIEIGWLNNLLESDSQREITKQIWRYDDKVIVTNGIAMIAINPDVFNCSNINPLTDTYEKTISEVLNYEYRSITSYNMNIDLQDFKKFLGKPEGVTKCDCNNVVRKCPKCNGKGVIRCNHGEEHDCPECNGKAEYYCDNCDDGWIKPNPRYVGIFDVVVNGNILAQYLQELHDVGVTISCNGEYPVRLSGQGWDVYILPIRYVKGEVRRYESKRPNRNIDGV